MSKPKGFWIDIEKSSYDELEAELNKTKKALRDTANGKPSEWAYVQLKADADKLAEALECCFADAIDHTFNDIIVEITINRKQFDKARQALKEYRGEK